MYIQPQKSQKQSYSVEAYYIHHIEHVVNCMHRKKVWQIVQPLSVHEVYTTLQNHAAHHDSQSLVDKGQSDVMQVEASPQECYLNIICVSLLTCLQ